jgi:diguanylate cyclase (GGDEF)-like protein
MKIDRLTGLPTHCSVPEYLEESGGYPFGVFVDIDGLNRLNHSYGHEAGDSALRQVASALNELSKSYEARTFRISGDEFLILLADPTSHAQAYEMAEAAVKAVADLRVITTGRAGGLLRAPGRGLGLLKF